MPRPKFSTTFTEERFWAKIDRSGGPDACWLWTGRPMTTGYGQIRYKGRGQGAHRVAYELAHGPIPAGQCVCHRCDVPACCNPAHLFLGSHAENLADMAAKGRSPMGDRHYTQRSPELRPRGERNGQAKLNADAVREIRRAIAAGDVARHTLAARYGVSLAVIGDVARRKTWKHIA